MKRIQLSVIAVIAITAAHCLQAMSRPTLVSVGQGLPYRATI